MVRSWLLLLLLAVAWRPTSASATAVHAHEQDGIAAAQPYYAPDGCWRTLTGWDLLHSIEVRLSQRSSRSAANDHCLASTEFLLADVRRILHAEREQVGDTVAPHSERLPYHATAPPLQR